MAVLLIYMEHSTVDLRKWRHCTIHLHVHVVGLHRSRCLDLHESRCCKCTWITVLWIYMDHWDVDQHLFSWYISTWINVLWICTGHVSLIYIEHADHDIAGIRRSRCCWSTRVTVQLIYTVHDAVDLHGSQFCITTSVIELQIYIDRGFVDLHIAKRC